MSTWMENLKNNAKKAAEMVWNNKGKIALGAAGIGVGIFLMNRSKKNNDLPHGEYELDSPLYPDAEDPVAGKELVMRFFDKDGNQYKDDIDCYQSYADDFF